VHATRGWGWSAVARPQRLAFEVERSLRVRPQQLAVLGDLEADAHGGISQLNTGTGQDASRAAAAAAALGGRLRRVLPSRACTCQCSAR